MAAGEAAVASYEQQARIMQAGVVAALAVWDNLDPAALVASWSTFRLGERLFLTTARAQELAAVAAAQATDAILAENGGDVPTPDGEVVTAALAGIASDGRGLDSLLLQPLITTNVTRVAGASPLDALAAGRSVLTRIVGTQVQDAGHASTGLSIAARRRTGWVRLVEPGACSRCVILAGRWYRYNSGFLRHPLCKCRNIPAAEDTPGLTAATDPMTHFHSLSEVEQNRQFTRAGAQAIRDGADISRVVNARRAALGLSAPGRSRPRGARVMPETIYATAKNRDDALRLLRLHGFLT